MKANDTRHIPTQKMKFLGHSAEPRKVNDRKQEIQVKKGEATHAFGKPDPDTGKGGHDRYLFHDNELGKEMTVEKGQTFTCSVTEAERIMVDFPDSFERVGGVNDPEKANEPRDFKK